VKGVGVEVPEAQSPKPEARLANHRFPFYPVSSSVSSVSSVVRGFDSAFELANDQRPTTNDGFSPRRRLQILHDRLPTIPPTLRLHQALSTPLPGPGRNSMGLPPHSALLFSRHSTLVSLRNYQSKIREAFVVQNETMNPRSPCHSERSEESWFLLHHHNPCGDSRPRRACPFLPKPRAKPRGKPKGVQRAKRANRTDPLSCHAERSRSIPTRRHSA